MKTFGRPAARPPCPLATSTAPPARFAIAPSPLPIAPHRTPRHLPGRTAPGAACVLSVTPLPRPGRSPTRPPRETPMQRYALASALLCILALSACSTVGDEQVSSQPATAAPSPLVAAEIASDATLDKVSVTGSRRQAVAFAPPPAPFSAMVVPQGQWQPANTENYAAHEDNPVHRTSEQPVSTFSIDVDTGSYANVRRMLHDGVRPPADAVRAEEMINYFRYGQPAPASLDVPFRVPTELAPPPWNGKRQLLAIGIKGCGGPTPRPPTANLVLLLDTSGPMNSPAKLPLLSQSMNHLANQTRQQDHVSRSE